MFGIIWFVIVVYIVIRCVNNTKKNGQTKPNQPRRPVQANRPGTYQTSGKWSGSQPPKTPQAPRMPQTPKAPQGQNTPRQPRKSTVSGYSQSPRPAQPKKKTENSILQKAKANAAEQFDVDTLEERGQAVTGRIPTGDEIMRDKAKERHIHSGHEMNSHSAELHNQPGIDDFDTYHLMDEVNDLIAKGYSGNLEFERDFLAEATDMLNRISSSPS